MAGKVDVVISVDAEYLLHDVALAGHVYHIGRGLHDGAFRSLLHEIVRQGLEYALDGIHAYLLAYEALYAAVIEFYALARDLLGIHVLDLTDDLAAGEFPDEERGAPEGERDNLRIRAALETERGVGLEDVLLGGLADGTGIEIGALDEDVGGGFGHARVLAAEHAGDAHRALGVGDDHVTVAEFAIDAVERADGLVLGGPADDDLSSGNLGGVEGVQGLADLE